MISTVVISNLARHRAYLAGEVSVAAQKLKALRIELATIDGALRLLDSGINPNAIKGIQRHYRLNGFKHGEMTRLVFSALRKADAPVSATAVAEGIASIKHLDLTNDLIQRVRLTMIRLASEGRVVRSGVHRGRLWALCPR